MWCCSQNFLVIEMKEEIVKHCSMKKATEQKKNSKNTVKADHIRNNYAHSRPTGSI